MEPEKAFLTLQPAATTVWMDGCNQPTAGAPAAPRLVAGAWPCHLRAEGIVTLPPARAQLGRDSQPRSATRAPGDKGRCLAEMDREDLERAVR